MTLDDIGYPIAFGQGSIGSVEFWGKDLQTGWFPCENPERPMDPYVLWHYDGRDCLGCRIAAKALWMRHPKNRHVLWLADRLGVHDVADPSILDACHNTGKMWKGLPYSVTSMDLDPTLGCDITGDFTAIPFPDNIFDVVAFDPPHLPNANASNDRTTGLADVYGIRVQDEMRAADHVGGMFVPFLAEARRVLRPNGIVIAKIADLVHNHAYQWQHVAFINAAVQLDGMTPCDLIVKADPASANLSSSKWKKVHHFRSAHLYWIVVRKGRCEATPTASKGGHDG